MNSQQTITIWTDGGARGNPGPAGIGVLITENEQKLAEMSEAIGVATNNQAEYRALLAGLHWLDSKQYDRPNLRVEIFTDSELMAYQVQGRYKVKNLDLQSLHQAVTSELKKYGSFIITPVRREKNKVADNLVNQALDLALAKQSAAK